MKKGLIYTFATMLLISANASDSIFDSMDKATEVKLAPAINTASSSAKSTTEVRTVTPTYKATIKEQKFASAIVNLDDAQVELRQELAQVKTKYTAALDEKEKAIQNCKNLKKEINAINKKMKNIEKSKKMINKNLQTPQ